jgi:SAM-dependent methyltransferase/UDP-N-acetylglucosamine transferase subunit ALG13
MDIVVTVGMGSWPFDRLLKAIAPLCRDHRVFAQTGTSRLTPPCDHRPFVPYPQLLERIQAPDVVVTHAGNTVRLVQRLGKLPVVVARRAGLGEMANDHQVEYLRHEERHGRVIAVWDVDQLPDVVGVHGHAEARLAAEPPLGPPADAAVVADRLDELWDGVVGNPFRRHPLRRYAYAWEELWALDGRHLDVGCGTGDFLGILAESTGRACVGVDADPGHVRDARRRYPHLDVAHVGIGAPLPYPDACFSSVSLLDVLEHCPNEDDLLAEVRRVLRPRGLLVLTVPARHVFSWLDPDNVKFRFPRVHRAVYSRRFGADVYRERFADTGNGLFGDISLGNGEHTNYRRDWLVGRLRVHAFEITRESGANLFWQWFHGPSLLAGPRLRARLEQAIWLDGKLFRSANLFLTARRGQ